MWPIRPRGSRRSAIGSPAFRSLGRGSSAWARVYRCGADASSVADAISPLSSARQARHDVLEQTCPGRDSDLRELARQLSERHGELGAAGRLDRSAHAPWIAFEALSRHRLVGRPRALTRSRRARGRSAGARVLRTYARQAGEDRGTSGSSCAPVDSARGAVGAGAAPLTRGRTRGRLASARAAGRGALRSGAGQLGQHAARGAVLARSRASRAVCLPSEIRGGAARFLRPAGLRWRSAIGRPRLTGTLRGLAHAR
jgi:hypothetical protein